MRRMSLSISGEQNKLFSFTNKVSMNVYLSVRKSNNELLLKIYIATMHGFGLVSI